MLAEEKVFFSFDGCTLFIIFVPINTSPEAMTLCGWENTNNQDVGHEIRKYIQGNRPNPVEGAGVW